jgi:putative hydrolase of the HAD superfamily
MTNERVILWDFDGTLGHRRGGTGFSDCMAETLSDCQPGNGISAAEIREFLRDGLPWHTSEVAHPELSSTDAWWRHVEPVLVRAYEGVGLAPDRASVLGRLARKRYVDVRYWELFHDTVPALSDLRDRGWRHVILSNHVPELEAIVAHLGLGGIIEATINSAKTGYEKPHPEAFAHARRAVGEVNELWMVGDNVVADVAGAEAAGIPAILIDRGNRSDVTAERTVRSLTDVGGLL